MKKVRLLFLSIILLSFNFASAKYTFTVFDVSKNVTSIRHGKTTSEKIKKGTTLNINDEIIIPFGNSITLRDVKTSRKYEFKDKGRFKISEIIKKQDDDNFFTRLFKSIANIINPKENMCRYNSKGVTLKSHTGVEAEIASHIKDYQAFGNKKSNISRDLIIDKVPISNKEFSFRISNNANKGYYINVAKINREDNSSHICINHSMLNSDEVIEISIYVAPNRSIEIPSAFIKTKKTDFIVIGSEREFSWSVLEKYLTDPYFEQIKYSNDIVIGKLK